MCALDVTFTVSLAGRFPPTACWEVQCPVFTCPCTSGSSWALASMMSVPELCTPLSLLLDCLSLLLCFCLFSYLCRLLEIKNPEVPIWYLGHHIVYPVPSIIPGALKKKKKAQHISAE